MKIRWKFRSPRKASIPAEKRSLNKSVVKDLCFGRSATESPEAYFIGTMSIRGSTFKLMSDGSVVDNDGLLFFKMSKHAVQARAEHEIFSNSLPLTKAPK